MLRMLDVAWLNLVTQSVFSAKKKSLTIIRASKQQIEPGAVPKPHMRVNEKIAADGNWRKVPVSEGFDGWKCSACYQKERKRLAKLLSTVATTEFVVHKKIRRARPQPVALSERMRKLGDDKFDNGIQHMTNSDIYLDRDAEHLRVMVDSIKEIAYNIRGEDSARNENATRVSTAHLDILESTLDRLKRLPKQSDRQCVMWFHRNNYLDGKLQSYHYYVRQASSIRYVGVSWSPQCDETTAQSIAHTVARILNRWPVDLDLMATLCHPDDESRRITRTLWQHGPPMGQKIIRALERLQTLKPLVRYRIPSPMYHEQEMVWTLECAMTDPDSGATSMGRYTLPNLSGLPGFVILLPRSSHISQDI
ncbi:hypothetical protein HBI23_141560 [Parastagonospora nodorum]|nr:hypothetical protein HBI79_126380 [Parastagonospora nodorum]KAH5247438.1 hypothetical protein HBI71_175530 [Parastagonospora nodorum]KAH5415684.1 hypothetical protein HBI47_148060 [Parastagonospora nodorum]KAH5657811.1 hypothetical protein HBI23_141560 [Parastagonospora nodorum]